jgi:hypothetical protein
MPTSLNWSKRPKAGKGNTKTSKLAWIKQSSCSKSLLNLKEKNLYPPLNPKNKQQLNRKLENPYQLQACNTYLD